MERTYFYARAVGNPHFVLQDIVTAVENAGLAAQIPLVKIERKARREFYIFLGVDDEDNLRIPGGLGQTLKLNGIWFDEDHPLKPADIKSMVQRQNIEIHGFKVLQYRRRIYEDPGDPFEQSDVWQPQEASPESCARFERLLHWLSACGEGTWETFRQTCNVLKVANDGQKARSALRRLSLLGHVDTSEDGKRWSVSPAGLVRFPDDPDSGFLSGQRTTPLLHSMNESWTLTETLQPYYPGPPRVVLDWSVPECVDGDTALGVADAGKTSTRLANLLPDLNGWKGSLQTMSNLNTASYHIERWEAGSFQPCDTVYDRDGIYFGETGMYRLSREADPSGRTMTLFFDEPGQRWLRGDWYGLRFLSLDADEGSVEAVHDSDVGELLIPATQRWPLLYEKVLTLASGLLPGRATNPDWMSYPRISLKLARTMCGKLNVNLQEE